jgi:hypothetical protein
MMNNHRTWCRADREAGPAQNDTGGREMVMDQHGATIQNYFRTYRLGCGPSDEVLPRSG